MKISTSGSEATVVSSEIKQKEKKLDFFIMLTEGKRCPR